MFDYPEAGVPHRILDNLSWLENIVHQTGDEYTFELGESVVTSVSFEEGFEMRLAGGSRILANMPLQFSDEYESFRLSSDAPQAVSVANRIESQEINQARISSDGTLNISFSREGVAGIKLVVGANAWKVNFSNGSSAVGLLGGGIELSPPQT
jgi:hypothetical protein